MNYRDEQLDGVGRSIVTAVAQGRLCLPTVDCYQRSWAAQTYRIKKGYIDDCRLVWLLDADCFPSDPSSFSAR